MTRKTATGEYTIDCVLISSEILTYYSDGYSTASNPVLSICGKGWSKALHQCAIQWEGCRTSQCRCEQRSTGSWTKPNPGPSGEFIIWSTPYIHCLMQYVTKGTQRFHLHSLSRWLLHSYSREQYT